MPKERLSFGSAALAILESSCCKAGDYFREMAVLIVVFIPLDLWKQTDITGMRILEVLGVSFGLFWIGMVLEWSSYGVKRGRKAWEAAQ